MKAHTNVDIIYLNKPDHKYAGPLSKVIPPPTSSSVRVHDLKKTYRQGNECLLAFKYMQTHQGRGDLSWSKCIVPNDEGRCPDGQNTVWVECEEGVEKLEALGTVKEMFDSERKMMVTTNESLNNNVAVMYNEKDEAAANFCLEHGWNYAYADSVYGSESEVVLFLIVICSNIVLGIHRWWSIWQGVVLSRCPGPS